MIRATLLVGRGGTWFLFPRHSRTPMIRSGASLQSQEACVRRRIWSAAASAFPGIGSRRVTSRGVTLPGVTVPVVALISVAALAISTPAGAASGPVRARPGPTQGDPLPAEYTDRYTDRDIRPGQVAPSSQQRALAARGGLATRWNSFGTPAAVTARTGVLASGLATDPETAARQYLGRSVGLFGLDARSVAALETVAEHRDRQGHRGPAAAAVRRRCRPPTTGSSRCAVKAGTVLHVTSSLTRDTATPPAATLSPAAALSAAAADAGLAAEQARPPSGSARSRVPMPGGGPAGRVPGRAHRRGHRPPGRVHLVRGRAQRQVLVRENLVDFDSDNPQLGGVPGQPAGRLQLDGQPGDLVPEPGSPAARARYGTRPPAAPGTSTRPPARRPTRPWATRRTTRAGLGRGHPAGPATPSPDRKYTLPLDQPVAGPEVRPGHARLAAAQRHRRRDREPVRDAQPDARLVLPARLHRGGLEPADGEHDRRRQGRRRRAGPGPGGRD